MAKHETVLMSFSGRSRSMLLRTMAGRSRPGKWNQQLLNSILPTWGVLNLLLPEGEPETPGRQTITNIDGEKPHRIAASE
jgi:hypothetical protein